MTARNRQDLITFGFSAEEFEFLMHQDRFRHDLSRAASVSQIRRAVFRAAALLDNWESTHSDQPGFPRALKPPACSIPWDG